MVKQEKKLVVIWAAEIGTYVLISVLANSEGDAFGTAVLVGALVNIAGAALGAARLGVLLRWRASTLGRLLVLLSTIANPAVLFYGSVFLLNDQGFSYAQEGLQGLVYAAWLVASLFMLIGFRWIRRHPVVPDLPSRPVIGG